MKLNYILSAFVALVATSSSFATPLVSKWSGFVSLGDTTSGQPAIKSNTDVFVSVPLLRAAEYTGTISSVSGNVVTLTGSPNLSASPQTGSFAPTSGIPHIIQIDSGNKEGLIAMVTSNTTDTLTIALQPGDSLTDVVNGDSITVRKATTVSNLFENSPVPALTQVLGFSATIPRINNAADLIYEFDGTEWIDTNSFATANNVILYPGESFFIRNQSLSPITSIVVTGDVNTSKFRTVLPASGVQQDIAFSFLGGPGEVIGTSGLGAVSVAGDQILVTDNSAAGLNKAAASIIEFDGTDWVDTNTFSPVSNTFKLEAGVGYFLRSAAAGNRPYANEPDYVPSL